MYQIEKDTVLTIQLLEKIINKYKTNEAVKLNRYHKYYSGKGQDIMNKYYADKTKPCNRIITNYCNNITQSFNGYLTGKPITYSSDDDIELIQNVLNYNDVATEDNEFLANALIYGVAGELMYLDTNGDIRFKTLDSREFIPIYCNDIEQELLAVIRFYPIDTVEDTEQGYYVELYTQWENITYKTNISLTGLHEIKRERNYFGMVPVNVFYLNKEETNIFDCIMGLQDAYNTLLSSEIDDYQAFVDAYLTITNLQVDSDDLENMRTNRVLVLGENGKAEYLTKNTNDTQIENILKNINDSIHKIAACPDFSQESFGTSSGTALRFRLLGFENRAGNIEKAMTKALQRRIECICNMISILGNDVFRDVKITFNRNLPIDMDSEVNVINSLRGLVSDKTLLAQVPFVQDVDAEMAQIEEQNNATYSLYNFSTTGVNNEVLAEENN